MRPDPLCDPVATSHTSAPALSDPSASRVATAATAPSAWVVVDHPAKHRQVRSHLCPCAWLQADAGKVAASTPVGTNTLISVIRSFTTLPVRALERSPPAIDRLIKRAITRMLGCSVMPSPTAVRRSAIPASCRSRGVASPARHHHAAAPPTKPPAWLAVRPPSSRPAYARRLIATQQDPLDHRIRKTAPPRQPARAADTSRSTLPLGPVRTAEVCSAAAVTVLGVAMIPAPASSRAASPPCPYSTVDRERMCSGTSSM